MRAIFLFATLCITAYADLGIVSGTWQNGGGAGAGTGNFTFVGNLASTTTLGMTFAPTTNGAGTGFNVVLQAGRGNNASPTVNDGNVVINDAAGEAFFTFNGNTGTLTGSATSGFGAPSILGMTSVGATNFTNTGGTVLYSWNGGSIAIQMKQDIFDTGPSTKWIGASQNANQLQPFLGVAANTIIAGNGQGTIPATIGVLSANYYSREAGSGADCSGGSTLSGGTITVTTSCATTTSRIFLVDTSSSITNVGSLQVSTKNAGSFVVKSSNALDGSTFDFFVFNKY